MTNGVAVKDDLETRLANMQAEVERLKAENERLSAVEKPKNGVSVTFIPAGGLWYEKAVKNGRGATVGKTPVMAPEGGIYRIVGLTFQRIGTGDNARWIPSDLDLKADRFDLLKDAILGT